MRYPIEYIKENHIPARDCDFVNSLFGNEYKNLLKNSEPVIIYGASSAGKEIAQCLQMHGIEILCFCDKNPSLIGTDIAGRIVISPEELLKSYSNNFVVIGVQNFKQEVYQFLQSHGLKRIGVILDDEQFYYYLQFPRWKYELADILIEQEHVSRAYNLLGDEKSRKIFLQRLTILSSYADYKSYKKYCLLVDFPSNLPLEKKAFASNFENEMYFQNDLVNIENGVCLLDAGAYDGDSAIQFIKAVNARSATYSKIYCFEPDTNNFQKLIGNLSNLPNTTCFNNGLWHKKDRLEFATSKLMYQTEAGIVQPNERLVINKIYGDSEVAVNSIDNLLFPEKIDIIKMDIEGAEENALKGGFKTIKKFKPQLIISAYHKKNDLYNLINLIEGIRNDYRIYLRQFSFSWSETVIIAK